MDDGEIQQRGPIPRPLLERPAEKLRRLARAAPLESGPDPIHLKLQGFREQMESVIKTLFGGRHVP